MVPWGITALKDHMSEAKYFRNTLSAYSHHCAIGAMQVHEALVAHYAGDVEACASARQKAQETFDVSDLLWDRMSDEEQQLFVSFMEPEEAND